MRERMERMRLWRKQAPEAAAAAVQLRGARRGPFGMLEDYVPLRDGETELYRTVREAVPVLDAAIHKIIRLTGGVSVRCGEPETERALREFLRTVPTGRGQYGIEGFLESYLDSLLVCGRAVGEMVPEPGMRGIAALLCGSVADVEIREGENAMDFALRARDDQGRMVELPYQALLLFTPMSPEAEHPYGVSMLRSLPFLTDILTKIYHTVGVNWERCGAVRYAVTCRDGGEGPARLRAETLAREWSDAMQDARGGAVRDFVAVGDVDIRVIGADNPILESEVPVRQILEQLVAKTGIPPFMLGLNWSSTERMSAQQADMLTTEITAIRRTLTPVLERVCRMWLRMRGEDVPFEVVWDDINLQDEVEEARAELYREQARKLRVENDRKEKEK